MHRGIEYKYKCDVNVKKPIKEQIPYIIVTMEYLADIR